MSSTERLATNPIAIASVEMGEEEEALALEVLRSGRLAQGPMVERLEAGFRALAGTDHAVAVSSGTAALVAALEALDVGPGDEVLTSPFTFVATLNAILEAGAVATFVDVGDDLTIPAASVAAALGSATRVVMPVHLYGLPADIGAITTAADERGVAVVEDASQAHGATVDGRPVGSFGVGCFSLYATKNVTAGEGGVITCDDAALADRLRLLRNQGMSERYCYEIAGHNYRLTELQAAIALPQLARLVARTEQRRENAARLDARARRCPGTRAARRAERSDARMAPVHRSDHRRCPYHERRAGSRAVVAGHRDRYLLPARRVRLRVLPRASSSRASPMSRMRWPRRVKCSRCPCTRACPSATSTRSSPRCGSCSDVEARDRRCGDHGRQPRPARAGRSRRDGDARRRSRHRACHAAGHRGRSRGRVRHRRDRRRTSTRRSSPCRAISTTRSASS